MQKGVHQLKFDMLWVVGGQIISVVAMLGMIKVWAVYLEPRELGLFMLSTSATSIIFGILLGPLWQAIFALYPGFLISGKATAARRAGIDLFRQRLFLTLALVVLVGEPVCWLLGVHWALPLMVAVLLIIDTYRMFEQKLFAAARRHRDSAIVVAGDLVFRLLFVWLFLQAGESSAYVALSGTIAGSGLFTLLVRVALSPEGRGHTASSKNHSSSPDIKSQISRLARPLVPSAILSNVTEMGNRYFIAAILGLQETGIFTVSYGLVKRPYSMLNHVGEMVMTPVLKQALENWDTKAINRAKWFWLLFIGILSIIGATLFYIVREPLVALFLSDKYKQAENLLFGLAIAVSLFNISNVYNWFALTLENSKATLMNNIVGSTATTIFTIILGLYWGLFGVVLALVIGYGVQLATSIITYRSALRKHAKLIKSLPAQQISGMEKMDHS